MAEMGVTALTENFCALHAMAGICCFSDIEAIHRVGEAWPAAAGIEFVIRCEERGSATDAAVCADFVAVPEFSAEGRLGTLLSRNMVLPRRKLSAPFGFWFDNFCLHAVVICVAASVQMPRYWCRLLLG